MSDSVARNLSGFEVGYRSLIEWDELAAKPTGLMAELTGDLSIRWLTNAKPHDIRRASQERHIKVASFRRITATYPGVSTPAAGSSYGDLSL